MEEQDAVPTARMHWAQLVLGRGHPIIIIVVLAAVGAAVCWFSLQQISFLTQTPTRYTMELEVATEGCADRRLPMSGSIGSFGPSHLSFRLLDEDDRPMFVGGCRVRSILLDSNLPLQPGRYGDSTEFIYVTGADPNVYMAQDNVGEGRDPLGDARENFRATIVAGDLRVLGRPDSSKSGPSFSTGVNEQFQQPRIRYEVAFHEKWQPVFFTMSFTVPENVRTYFDLSGIRIDGREPPVEEDGFDGDGPGATYGELDMSVSFRTDEVLLVRGLMSDSGDAMSVDGYLRFGLENSDAESKRESGNVRFSAILGIGIALIVEAFVILLALGVRGLAARLGVVGKAVAD
ncbi:MAG: hypothetical protein OXH68_17355 [Gammaproteobacteria bacterium]|nr:hypothetical protein [Gammaproteobacteria bacterium]